jgi:hypothetical protein
MGGLAEEVKMKKIILFSLFLILPSLIWAQIQFNQTKSDSNRLAGNSNLVFLNTDKFTMYIDFRLDTTTYKTYQYIISQRTTADSSISLLIPTLSSWLRCDVGGTTGNMIQRIGKNISSGKRYKIFIVKSGSTYDTTNLHMYNGVNLFDSLAAVRSATLPLQIGKASGDSFLIIYPGAYGPRITLFNFAIYKKVLSKGEINNLIANVNPLTISNCVMCPDLRSHGNKVSIPVNSIISDLSKTRTKFFARTIVGNTPRWINGYPFLYGYGQVQ